MVLIECSPPFQWKPSVRREGMAGGWRFMWAWFAIGYVPYDFNGYVEGIARAGVELERLSSAETQTRRYGD